MFRCERKTALGISVILRLAFDSAGGHTWHGIKRLFPVGVGEGDSGFLSLQQCMAIFTAWGRHGMARHGTAWHGTALAWRVGVCTYTDAAAFVYILPFFLALVHLATLLFRCQIQSCTRGVLVSILGAGGGNEATGLCIQ